MKKKKTIAVSLDIELIEKAKRAAADQDRNLSNFMNYVLQTYFKSNSKTE